MVKPEERLGVGRWNREEGGWKGLVRSVHNSHCEVWDGDLGQTEGLSGFFGLDTKQLWSPRPSAFRGCAKGPRAGSETRALALIRWTVPASPTSSRRGSTANSLSDDGNGTRARPWRPRSGTRLTRLAARAVRRTPPSTHAPRGRQPASQAPAGRRFSRRSSREKPNIRPHLHSGFFAEVLTATGSKPALTLNVQRGRHLFLTVARAVRPVRRPGHRGPGTGSPRGPRDRVQTGFYRGEAHTARFPQPEPSQPPSPAAPGMLLFRSTFPG